MLTHDNLMNFLRKIKLIININQDINMQIMSIYMRNPTTKQMTIKILIKIKINLEKIQINFNKMKIFNKTKN